MVHYSHHASYIIVTWSLKTPTVTLLGPYVWLKDQGCLTELGYLSCNYWKADQDK